MRRTRQNKKVLKEASLKGIADYIKDNKVCNVIVMTGAGISTAAGIPDFRSEKTGLYHNLQKFNLPYAEAVFDISYFVEKPEPFYALAKELYPGNFLPTKTHYFVRLLKEKGILLRNFTQNIDTLERMTGLDQDYIIEAHGSFATASCVGCKRRADPDMVKEKSLKGQVPRCEHCDDLIKPDITFFGENLPKRFFDHLKDFNKADLLIVIGTSLKVQPFARLIDRVPDYVPRLLINKELAGVYDSKTAGFDFDWKNGLDRDVAYLDNCDEGVEKLASLLGWQEDLDKLFKDGHQELKSAWKEAKKEQEPEAKDDKEVDKLAEELEKLTAKDTLSNIKDEKE